MSVRSRALRCAFASALGTALLFVCNAAAALDLRSPAAGAELTWMPVRVEIAFDAAADIGTLSVLLNGNDITGDFTLAPPAGGEIVATAEYVWSGYVALGSNQIDVSIDVGGSSVVAGSSFDTVGDPYADSLVSYTQGTNGGYNAAMLPGVVLGKPLGGELTVGSLDVVSIGLNGSLVVRFDDNVIVDGPGADFTVFENAFIPTGSGGSQPPYAEPALVKVSQDGVNWIEFSCTLHSTAGPYWPGCTGSRTACPRRPTRRSRRRRRSRTWSGFPACPWRRPRAPAAIPSTSRTSDSRGCVT
jgi:hypothetical protein